MNIFEKIGRSFDAFQQRHTAFAFPVAVVKRYGDDQAGKQAALITYYGFLSLFPLLLLLITVLGIIMNNNPKLQAEILSTVLQTFPALGDDLQRNVGSARASGLALVLQTLVLLYGARGFANILQETFNNLWHVDKEHRPGFVGDNLRSIGMMLAVGVGIIASTVLSFVLQSILNTGPITTLLLTLFNAAVVFGLFLVVFRLGTSNTINTRKLVLGAAIASIGTIIVQHFGGYIMSQQLPKLNSSYGSFAITLGILFWMYLQSQVIMYAIEITTVRTQRDWPKKLFD
ncbi:MAG TPA: YihY/virulence factor BrkB family protein [Candidatus Limnocylindrales bacterium]|nr:YihY/virulence factor BrkB family protein [Candidatus Limnocylindrales bacterium]